MKEIVLNHLGDKNEPKITHYLEEQKTKPLQNLEDTLVTISSYLPFISPLERGIEKDHDLKFRGIQMRLAQQQKHH